MKYLFILLLCTFTIKSSLCQSNNPKLVFGKYEATEIIFYKIASDTSKRIDDMNNVWGKKTLTFAFVRYQKASNKRRRTNNAGQYKKHSPLFSSIL